MDLKATFDSVNKEAFWIELRNISISKIILNLIRDLHNNAIRQIHLDCHVPARVHATSGVKQGCILDPAIFCCAMDLIIIWITTAKSTDLHLDPCTFSELDYADNVNLLTGSPNTLPAKLLQMETKVSKLGLCIS